MSYWTCQHCGRTQLGAQVCECQLGNQQLEAFRQARGMTDDELRQYVTGRYKTTGGET
jgi:hypothetical protein